jgi:hypothetical protein
LPCRCLRALKNDQDQLSKGCCPGNIDFDTHFTHSNADIAKAASFVTQNNLFFIDVIEI